MRYLYHYCLAYPTPTGWGYVHGTYATDQPAEDHKRYIEIIEYLCWSNTLDRKTSAVTSFSLIHTERRT